MNIVDILAPRQLIQDQSDPEMISRLGPGDTFYVGIDPSAPSLQLGNLVPLIVAIHLGRAGLNPILLFGGATGSIGDPSGKNSERQLMDLATIEANAAHQRSQVEAIMARAGVKATFVNNYEWTSGVSVLDFLRDVGKHFTVNYMLAKEVVKARLDGEGISYTEFSYMLLQAFDFLHLYENFNCRLQIGGSDQWGNITAGLELLRRKGKTNACTLSIPLVLDSQGRKFGKSAGNALWLDPAMTSPYRLHQFFLNIEDARTAQLLRVFTFLEEEQIAGLESSLRDRPEERAAQRALADSVCTLVHGEAATRDARRSAEVLFGGSLEGLSDAQLLEIFSEVPSSSHDRQQLGAQPVSDLFAASGLCKSKGEARKLITGGGAYINNRRIMDCGETCAAHFSAGSAIMVLRSGKKNYHLVRLS